LHAPLFSLGPIPTTLSANLPLPLIPLYFPVPPDSVKTPVSLNA
jgi:hypothetical protein